MRRRRIVGGLAALVALAVATLPLLRAAGRFLVEDDPLQHADAIVVLAGSYPDRILEAAALYRDGWAPRLILCREPENAGFRKLRALGVRVPRPFEINRTVAEQLGVPADAITVLDRPAASTVSEADVVLAEIQARGYRSILLVTSKYHSHRAGLIYRHLAGGRVAVIVRAARDDDFQPDAWWRDRASARRVAIEYQKLLTFLLVDRWRMPPVTPAVAATPAPA